jgi:hypothetical protein
MFVLIKAWDNLNKLLKKKLNQVLERKCLIDAKHQIWDMIIEQMWAFISHLELFHYCEIVIIANA